MLLGITIFIIVIVAICLIIVFTGIGIYNSIVTMRNATDGAWSQIDVQLRKRYDLIPNLVETVKGYAAHEKETLQKVIKARTLGMNADNIKDQAKAENQITGALKSLFAVSERYPDLKADAQFSNLMQQLNSVEASISSARQNYNNAVLSFNNRIQTFPGNIIAGMFKFSARDYFEIEEEVARGPVKVKF